MNESAAGPSADTVQGERSVALVRGMRTLQSRMSGVLAALLMAGLGLGALSWYYAHAFSRPTRVRDSAQAAARARAQGEMVLPALGPVTPPLSASPPSAAPSPSSSTIEGTESLVAEPPLPAAVAAAAAATPPAPGDRRLTGAVFNSAPATPVVAVPSAPPASPSEAASPSGASAPLGSLLAATALPAVEARRLPAAHYLLAKGSFLDCTLETAIDSTVPGMTSCLTAADTLSADGAVVLLERGTRLIGETRGQLSAGQARLFVLWSEARTPGGLLIPLDSPGTDALGRAGVGGHVERHFWERFGAGILVSLLDGAVQTGVQASRAGGGTVLYAPGPQDPLSEALREGARIAPTLQVTPGTRLQVLVARDVDFRAVHERGPPLVQ
ncbi:MAG: TrbI/VirB10 family protein [Gammaproteobacteria bacterium]|nr:TrbI/VirB10 family protein [Gammaproteobacteria bacterium]